MATFHRNHRTLYSVMILLCLVIFSLSAHAQKEPAYTALVRDTLSAGKTLTVRDVVFFDPALKPTVLKTNSVSGIITLRINEYTTKAFPDSFQATVKLRVVYTAANNMKDSIKEEVLILDYHKNKPYNRSSTITFENAYQVQVKVLEISTLYASKSVVAPLLE